MHVADRAVPDDQWGAQARRALQDLRAEVGRFGDRAQSLGAGARARIEPRIRALRLQVREAQRALDQARGRGGAAVQDVRDGASEALRALERSIGKAWQEFERGSVGSTPDARATQV
jgi:hypothetical protein